MRKTRVDVVIDSDVESVWNVLTDWPRQSEWMLATTIDEAGVVEGHGIGGSFTARTGIGPFVVADDMIVTTWDPPRRVDVNHVGKLVRGSGVFEVYALPERRSRVSWTEYIEVPFGAVGAVAWPLVRLGFEWGARRSLSALRRIVETDS